MVNLAQSALLVTSVPAALGLTFSFPDCTSAPLKGNGVCDTSQDAVTRARAIVELFTDEELSANTVNTSPGVPRLGLPNYEWWSEALHGVARSPGVTFASPGAQFSYATSFPQPILLGATFDDSLIKAIATVTSTEARAFNNAGRAGLDFWTPNINPFKDPRWGRGQETPGEDPYHISRYVYNLIDGLQGGIDPKQYKVIADCKHFAAYDLEEWKGVKRYAFDAQVSLQDLSEYYLPPFQTCVRDAKVASVMCSYNAVNGVPACASKYLLQDVLRDYWGFNEDGRWVTSDCDAVKNIYDSHFYTTDPANATALALKAGTDIDCGKTYGQYLPEALDKALIEREDLERALIRQYSSLVRLGYFDSADSQPYRQLGWDDVATQAAKDLAHTAAVEGYVLLENDGTLPFKSSIHKVAFIGPWANATTLMQGNYFGNASSLISPVQGASDAGYATSYNLGTTVSGTDTSGFKDALDAAKGADAIVFAGGLDQQVERETRDRLNVTWPGVQLDLIDQLTQLGKPLVVVQFGGGQVDGTVLKNNPKVNAFLWGGFPGQSGGAALADILSGKAAPAGRLPITQYPKEYSDQVEMTDMTLRPSANNPGRTYMWYTGTPVYPFGHGLHYADFEVSWTKGPAAKYQTSNIQSVSTSGNKKQDLDKFDTFELKVKNIGKVTSDYVALVFLSGGDGPQPAPKKRLIGYQRLKQIKPGEEQSASFEITLGSIARADENGNLRVYGGSYELAVDTGTNGLLLTQGFEVEGQNVQITQWPQVG